LERNVGRFGRGDYGEAKHMLTGNIVVLGGTGSLGQSLVKCFLATTDLDVTVFSRSEEKQRQMKAVYPEAHYIIGDVRDYDAVYDVLFGVNYVILASALKQIPTVENFPFEGIKTNILGAQNVIRAAKAWAVDVVVGISTDKAVKPVNAYGATKMLMERLFTAEQPVYTKFILTRYGNVMGSTGSVIPLFASLSAEKKPLPVTDQRMTRFLLTLNQAVDTVMMALQCGNPGEIWIPQTPSANIYDLAQCFSNDIAIVGSRPGEKVHEILVSEEELPRTVAEDEYLVVQPSGHGVNKDFRLDKEFSSADYVLEPNDLQMLLKEEKWI